MSILVTGLLDYGILSGVRLVEKWDTLYCRYKSVVFVFFQAEDGIRDLVRSRGLGDVYKRQPKSG